MSCGGDYVVSLRTGFRFQAHAAARNTNGAFSGSVVVTSLDRCGQFGRVQGSLSEYSSKIGPIVKEGARSGHLAQARGWDPRKCGFVNFCRNLFHRAALLC